MPSQRAELLVGPARAEHIGTLARIEAVALSIDNVVDAVKKKAKRKDNVEEAKPEADGTEIENTAERHEVEEDGGGPKARTGYLEKKFEVGKVTGLVDSLSGGLGGDAHRVD